jgi:hypothetical protein
MHKQQGRFWRISTAIFIITALIHMNACNNAADKNTADAAVKDDGRSSDTGYTGTYIKPENQAVNTYTKPEDLEKAERQKVILMQIDSTYTAIELLDDAKAEMTELSPAELSLAERNTKSKAIFSINLIQNDLTRTLDASILTNLKTRTNELAGITAQLEKNVSHLQSVTQKLNKATQCIGRLTNLMAMGLSKGWIKPLTPKNSSAETVKAGLN